MLLYLCPQRDFLKVHRFSTSQVGLVQLCVDPFFIGTWCFGVYGDRMVGVWKEKRSGTLIPEDRLRATWLPICFIVVGVLIYGWCFSRMRPGLEFPCLVRGSPELECRACKLCFSCSSARVAAPYPVCSA